jgi:hypothetical protein
MRVRSPTRQLVRLEINAVAIKWDTFLFAVSRTFSE